MGQVNGVTPVLEVALTATMYAASPTWTDLIAGGRKVVEVEWSHGQEDAATSDSAGWLRVLAENGDNQLDPDNPASAYFPNLVRNRQIRFRGSLGSTFDCFAGWIDRIVVNEDPDDAPTVTIWAVDALGLAERDKERGVGFRRKALALAPSAYWRLGDQDSLAVARDETGNNRQAAYAARQRAKATGLLVADEDSGASLGTRAGVVVGTSQAGLSGTSHGVFLLIRPSALPAVSDTIFYQDVGGGDFVRFALQPSGAVQLMNNGGGLSISPAATATVGKVAAVGFRRAGTSWTVGLHDGDALSTATGTFSVTATASSPVVGGTRTPGTFSPGFAGDIDEVVVWSST
ncbi:MAG: hypothetical protein ACRD2W_18415, partial [Acidimicrobiales bacterium]